MKVVLSLTMMLLILSTKLGVILVQAKSNYQIARSKSPYYFPYMIFSQDQSLSPDDLNILKSNYKLKIPFCTGLFIGGCNSFIRKKKSRNDFLAKPWVLLICAASTGGSCMLILSIDIFNCTVGCTETTMMIPFDLRPSKIYIFFQFNTNINNIFGYNNKYIINLS